MAEQPQTLTIQQAIDLGVQHHNAGRLSEAESLYHQILQSDPNQVDALHLLGVIARQVGGTDLAVDLINQAVAITPIRGPKLPSAASLRVPKFSRLNNVQTTSSNASLNRINRVRL